MSRIPLNVPNVLTLFRFALVPVTATLIYFELTIPALAVYILACSTDLLDGYIARRHKLVTEEGVLLDPLADKLMAVFAVLAFTVTDVLPWPVLVIIIVKELLMVAGGVFLYYRKIVTPANTFGKIAAFVFNTSIAFTFLHDYVGPWHVYVICFALLLSIVSLFQYAYLNLYKKIKSQTCPDTQADEEPA